MENIHPLMQQQLAANFNNIALPVELHHALQQINESYSKQEKEIQRLSQALEKINHEMDRFVYSVSHDLRAPMASLLGLLNISEQEEDLGAIRQYQGLMHNSVIRMERFITNLVNYSSSDRLENQPELIDFNEIVEEINSSLRHLPNAFSIDFIQEYELEEPFYTDVHKLKIILSNLLSNAILFHNPAQPKPFIRLSVQNKAGNALISIQDNGQGIEKEYHDKIFEMFFRGNMGSTGNGLGLYIVKRTVENLQGQLSFHSEIGEGSTFNIELPCLNTSK